MDGAEWAEKDSMIRVYSKPAMRDPLLLVGLPGIGLVSKLAADHLVKITGAKKFASLYSKNFPNQIIALKSGRMRLFSMRFYHKKIGSRDVVILRGDVQPLTVESQYDVCLEMLGFFKKLGGREVVAMAGYAVNKKNEKPVIYATSTDRGMFEKFLKLGAKKNENVVPVVGLAGLLPGIAGLLGMRGACLLAETPGNLIDAKGAAALLEIVGKLVGQKIDAKHLEQRAKKTEETLRKLEERARAEQPGMGMPGMAPEVIKKDVTYIR